MTNSGVEMVDVDDECMGDCDLDYDTMRVLETNYQIRFLVWTKGMNPKTDRPFFHLYYTGSRAYTKEVFLHYQCETERFLMITDLEKYFVNYFICQNRRSSCYFTFHTRKLRDQHQELCCKEKVKIQQVELGPSGALIEKAEKAGLIPKTHHRRDFLFYDIETVLPKSIVKTTKTSVFSTHEVVSIAVNR